MPDGITSVRDLPWPLFEAVQRGLDILGWIENVPAEDMPARRIWMDNVALSEHFEMVKRRRRQDRDAASKGQEITDPVMNPAAKGLIVGG